MAASNPRINKQLPCTRRGSFAQEGARTPRRLRPLDGANVRPPRGAEGVRAKQHPQPARPEQLHSPESSSARIPPSRSLHRTSLLAATGIVRRMGAGGNEPCRRGGASSRPIGRRVCGTGRMHFPDQDTQFWIVRGGSNYGTDSQAGTRAQTTPHVRHPLRIGLALLFARGYSAGAVIRVWGPLAGRIPRRAAAAGALLGRCFGCGVDFGGYGALRPVYGV